MNKLEQKLSSSLVIFDGAMGTEIYRRNFFVNASYEQLSLTQPDVIRAIHRSYIEAGAEVLTTNTFNANARRLGRFGLADQTAAINRAGVRLAREVAGDKALIAGSVGPVGDSENPADTRTKQELLREQFSALTEADFVLFESIRMLPDLRAALEVAAEFPETPFAVSFACDPHSGDSLADFLRAVEAAPRQPTAVGLNCGPGPEALLENLEVLMHLTKLPVIAQPNAGAPRNIDGRMLYMTSSEYFSTYARRYEQLGAAAIGGCCGIGPEHIAELVRSLKPLARAEKTKLPEIKTAQELPPPLPAKERSALGAKLHRGEFVRTVEITPPRGFDFTKTIAGAKLCKAAGIDAVNLPDGPRASARITPLVAAIVIEREAGIATIPHCCCRDKSLLGLQASLLGYAGAGIRNLLFITGDPPKLGDYPFSSGVFDVDSIGLTKLQMLMNRGVDLAGQPLNAPTRTLIGVGADPNAIDLDREYRRLCEKAEAGADFIVTQPVFDPEALFRFLDRIAHLHLPLIAGVWPLTSLRNAQFMKNEVPGVIVPEKIIERMGASADRECQKAAGIAIAREMLSIIRPRVQGVQVSAPFGKVELALEVLK